VNLAHVALRAAPRGEARLRWIVVGAGGAAVALLALRHGGFSTVDRTALGTLAVWTVGLAAVLGVRGRLGREAATVCAGFALLLAATALSLLWAPSAERALLEVDRIALYGAVVAIVAGATPPRLVRAGADALWAGIVAVALVALAGRLFPALAPGQSIQLVPALGSRLSWPIGYWNGLGILVALAVPLVVERAARAGRAAPATLAAVPVVAAVLVLSASRSGVAVALAGVLALVALVRQRGRLVVALAAATAGGGATYAILHSRTLLLDRPEAAGAAREGRIAALLLVLVAVATPALYVGLDRLARRLPPLSRRAGRGLAVAVGVALAVGVLAAHPLARVHAFTTAPDLRASANPAYVQQHLLASGGSGRWQMWSAALDELAAHPLGGGGAGSYGAWWTRHRPFALTSAYAHSLYLQTVAELGLLGIAALLTFVGAIAWAIRKRIGVADDRPLTAALAAVVVAFACAAAIDWMWEIPVVALVAFAALGLLLADAPATPRLRPAVRAPLAAALALLLVAQVLPLLAGLRLRQSDARVRAGALAPAYGAALDARTLTPWDSAPYLQLALVLERLGRLDGAAAAIHGAIVRDRQDWRLEAVAARIALERGDPDARNAALARVRALNPRAGVNGSGASP